MFIAQILHSVGRFSFLVSNDEFLVTLPEGKPYKPRGAFGWIFQVQWKEMDSACFQGYPRLLHQHSHLDVSLIHKTTQTTRQPHKIYTIVLQENIITIVGDTCRVWGPHCFAYHWRESHLKSAHSMLPCWLDGSAEKSYSDGRTLFWDPMKPIVKLTFQIDKVGIFDVTSFLKWLVKGSLLCLYLECVRLCLLVGTIASQDIVASGATKQPTVANWQHHNCILKNDGSTLWYQNQISKQKIDVTKLSYSFWARLPRSMCESEMGYS